ncbi:MAG: hypothetical protein R3C28_01780 [Pirellulaceae bacterium]
MMQQYEWIPNSLATAMFAARFAVQGHDTIDPSLSPAIQPWGAKLSKQIANAQAWDDTVALAILTTDPAWLSKQIVKQNSANILSADSNMPDLINQLHNVVLHHFPRFENDILIRIQPMKLQWEAVGPGLVKSACRSLKLLVPSQIKIALIWPLQGGSVTPVIGQAQLALEAVLTNSHPVIPEVLRLGWGVLQLGLPAFAWNDHRILAQTLCALAILQAAEDLDLVCLEPETLAAAATTWRLPWISTREQDLLDWWRANQHNSQIDIRSLTDAASSPTLLEIESFLQDRR